MFRSSIDFVHVIIGATLGVILGQASIFTIHSFSDMRTAILVMLYVIGFSINTYLATRSIETKNIGGVILSFFVFIGFLIFLTFNYILKIITINGNHSIAFDSGNDNFVLSMMVLFFIWYVTSATISYIEMKWVR